MICPNCGSKKKLLVIDTRTTDENHVRRKRSCYACGYVFTTYEIPAAEYTKYKK